ncbi:MAG: hypothetical protein N2053_07210, partial [Chitinispirillaceae bacterium]|nr:hypothetical protein [Chitinispirillaceae bacterium]
DIVPNHLISVKLWDFPKGLHKYKNILEHRSMLVKKAKSIPIECVVRGYLSGSAWKEYQQNYSICGIKLPKGLRESDKLPEPIFTPATKEEFGHDVNVTQEFVEKKLGKDIVHKLKEISLTLYREASQYAESKGIIIADRMDKVTGDAIVIGAVVTLTESEVSTFGTGSAKILFSRQALNKLNEYCNNILTKITQVSWKEGN